MSTIFKPIRILAKRIPPIARIISERDLLRDQAKLVLSRSSIAQKFLKGRGIEIGALADPLTVSDQTHVSYLDRMSNSELRKQYPELKNRALVKLSYIGDGEKLDNINDRSQDFVIANHFLEHCENPILAITNMLRILKKSGVLYLAVPDKRFTFDKERSLTPLSHLIEDYEQGPEKSRRTHYADYSKHTLKYSQDKSVEQKTQRLQTLNYSIHFHVWTQVEIVELLCWLRARDNHKFDIELMVKNGPEIIIVLSKQQ